MMVGHRKVNLKGKCHCGSDMVTLEGNWFCKNYLTHLLKKERAEKVIKEHKRSKQ